MMIYMISNTHSGGVVDRCEVGGNLFEGNGAVLVEVNGGEPGVEAVAGEVEVSAGGSELVVEGLKLHGGQVSVFIGVVLVEDFLGCGGVVGHV